jgi:DNA-binding NarL/FixJ family response regulator
MVFTAALIYSPWTMPRRIQILVADDHQTMRRIVAGLISRRPEWELCAEAADGQQAVDLSRILCPDVAILDVQMPRLNGLEAARQILRHCPDAIVVSDSIHNVDLFVDQLKEIGVKGFVDKNRLGNDLLPTIEAVLRGEIRFPLVSAAV